MKDESSVQSTVKRFILHPSAFILLIATITANAQTVRITTKPDFRPYKCVPVDARIFDPEKAKDPKDPDYGKARLLPSISMDDPEETEKVLRRGEKEAKPK